MLKDPRFWLGAVVAFVLGLGLGLGLYVWKVNAVTADSRREVKEAEERLAELEASNGELTAKLASAEASASELEAQLTKIADEDEDSAGEPGSQEPKSSGAAPKILDRSVSPEMVAPTAKMKLSVKVKGDAEKVRMRIVSRDRSLGYDKSWYLTEGASSGGTATWTRSIKAPGDPGEYRYYASAWGGGERVEMAGVSAWTFLVELP